MGRPLRRQLPGRAEALVALDVLAEGDSPVDTDRFNGTEAQLLSFTRMPRSR